MSGMELGYGLAVVLLWGRGSRRTPRGPFWLSNPATVRNQSSHSSLLCCLLLSVFDKFPLGKRPERRGHYSSAQARESGRERHQEVQGAKWTPAVSHSVVC